MKKCPKGRKGYQGRVERSHGIDDEEFYLPNLLEIKNEEEFLNFAKRGYTGIIQVDLILEIR